MTETETALAAVFDALAAKCAAAGMPAPHRNEALPTRVAQAGALFIWINQWDGSTTVVDEDIGADVLLAQDPAAKPYQIECRPLIDFSVTGGTQNERNAAFDLGLRTINAAVRPVLDGGELEYLGGAVDASSIEEVLRDGSGTITEGIPNTRGASVTALLTYTSSTPF